MGASKCELGVLEKHRMEAASTNKSIRLEEGPMQTKWTEKSLRIFFFHTKNWGGGGGNWFFSGSWGRNAWVFFWCQQIDRPVKKTRNKSGWFIHFSPQPVGKYPLGIAIEASNLPPILGDEHCSPGVPVRTRKWGKWGFLEPPPEAKSQGYDWRIWEKTRENSSWKTSAKTSKMPQTHHKKKKKNLLRRHHGEDFGRVPKLGVWNTSSHHRDFWGLEHLNSIFLTNRSTPLKTAKGKPPKAITPKWSRQNHLNQIFHDFRFHLQFVVRCKCPPTIWMIGTW